MDIRLTDDNGFDRTSGFKVIPPAPTNLGTVAVAGSTSGNWLILPSNVGITETGGQGFQVVAVISYIWNGVQYTVRTLPEAITVYPAP